MAKEPIMTTAPARQIPGVYHRRVGDITVTAVSEAGVESTPAGPVNKTIACP